MNITNDIHTKILVPISVCGYFLTANYYYQAEVTGSWPHAENFSLLEYMTIVLFLSLPLLIALFRHNGKGLTEFNPAQEDLAAMGSFRQQLNSPKGIERIYMVMMYPVPIMLCFYLITGGFK
ncbi:MAG: hypothetical protein ACJAQS_001295 [Porticoccus sp.]|jgi:hypothetical protein